MSLTPEQVRHVAGLARLALTPGEQELFLGQLSAVLEAMEQLRELDTDAVEPTRQVGFGPVVLREDEVVPSLSPERAVAQAPSPVGTSFGVPRVLE